MSNTISGLLIWNATRTSKALIMLKLITKITKSLLKHFAESVQRLGQLNVPNESFNLEIRENWFDVGC